MTDRIYFDHNATSPARPEAIKAVAYAMTVIGNASAQHGHGRAARNLVSDAREAIGLKLGLCAQDIIFTAGGTESDNTVPKHPISISKGRFVTIFLGDFHLVETGGEIKLREILFAFQPVEYRMHVTQATAIRHQELVEFTPVDAQP